ncbi:type II secretion system protein [Jeotgalibacillus sp. S-D1]|uniref:type II secretion system protein n=1 Tax=Jeotgalibacillus sp. S-D1 TaxID=2552189 RepID=UPI00105AA105|nr:type II secretion system protein [Jeotgalibacillus sp. S-D1]TDL34599.1 type II secretion system protein [Jeotgalibacillus sp. S-D1]
MLKNNQGFALYESMLALGCITFLCLTILPLLSIIVMKVEDSKERANSWVVLHEQIQSIHASGQIQSFEIIRDGVAYTTILDEGEGGLCIHYETRSKKKKTCLS